VNDRCACATPPTDIASLPRTPLSGWRCRVTVRLRPRAGGSIELPRANRLSSRPTCHMRQSSFFPTLRGMASCLIGLSAESGSTSRGSHIIAICRASRHRFSLPGNCKTCAALRGGLDDAIFPVLDTQGSLCEGAGHRATFDATRHQLRNCRGRHHSRYFATPYGMIRRAGFSGPTVCRPRMCCRSRWRCRARSWFDRSRSRRRALRHGRTALGKLESLSLRRISHSRSVGRRLASSSRPRMGATWPFNYAGLEPLNKRRWDWRRRYAQVFQLGPSPEERENIGLVKNHPAKSGIAGAVKGLGSSFRALAHIGLPPSCGYCGWLYAIS
jgi:hypothetical protein